MAKYMEPVKVILKKTEWIEITPPFAECRSFLFIKDIKDIGQLDSGRKYCVLKRFGNIDHRFFPTYPYDIKFVEKALGHR